MLLPSTIVSAFPRFGLPHASGVLRTLVFFFPSFEFLLWFLFRALFFRGVVVFFVDLQFLFCIFLFFPKCFSISFQLFERSGLDFPGFFSRLFFDSFFVPGSFISVSALIRDVVPLIYFFLGGGVFSFFNLAITFST